jgi:hypothetical protein
LEKVAFLDIDGPMIPSGQFLINRMCSWQRDFPAIPIACMNALCERSGAKIVLNTTHNNPIDGVPDIQEMLIRAGLKAEHFHKDAKTSYPNNSIHGGRRMLAIDGWLDDHPEVTHWVAFDDANFTDKKNLILIDMDSGIHVGHLNRALGILGGKPFIIL